MKIGENFRTFWSVLSLANLVHHLYGVPVCPLPQAYSYICIKYIMFLQMIHTRNMPKMGLLYVRNRTVSDIDPSPCRIYR